MLILTIKTNEPTAEIGLCQDDELLENISWEGHRQLSVTIHKKIQELLSSNNKKLNAIDGVAFFAGPGSFTGLRIGAAVASSLAYGLQVPIISTKGKEWEKQAIAKLKGGANEKTAKPFYGGEPHITRPKE